MLCITYNVVMHTKQQHVEANEVKMIALELQIM